MKSFKSLLTLGFAIAFSTHVLAENNNSLNTFKTPTKETINNQVSYGKQALNSSQNSAKSALTEKVSNTVNNTKDKVTTSAKNSTVQTTATARETLNSAKASAIEKATSTQSTLKNTTKKSKININTADVETLQALEGIGEVKAKAIVEYRKKHGHFKKAADLTKVSGIGDSTVTKIKSAISFQ